MFAGCAGVDPLVQVSHSYPTPGYVRITPIEFVEENFHRRFGASPWASRST
jgi:hypothetical protein